MFNFLSVLSRFLHVMLGIATPNNFPPPLDKEEEHQAFLLARDGDAAARVKRLISLIDRKNLLRRHALALADLPGIGIMTVFAPHRAALTKHHKANAGAIHGAETLYRMYKAIHS